MNGALPPNSRCTRFTPALAAAMIFFPVTVSPVTETMATSGCVTSAAPTSPPGPVTTLSTPAGRPASSAALAISRVESGVQLAGLTTTVLPAASAGPRCRRRPGLNPILRRGRGAVHVLRPGPGDAGDAFLGRWVDDLGCFL